LDTVLEDDLDELLQFIAFLKFRKEQTETHLASQATLEGLAQPRRRRGMATFVKGDVVVVPFPFSV
jgi:hypothetical protein